MTKKEMQKYIDALEGEVAFLRELVRELTREKGPQAPPPPTPGLPQPIRKPHYPWKRTPWFPPWQPGRTDPDWSPLPWDWSDGTSSRVTVNGTALHPY